MCSPGFSWVQHKHAGITSDIYKAHLINTEQLTTCQDTGKISYLFQFIMQEHALHLL